ncbi:hypothetical protein CGRA01v4_08648 [Colletotrichum graminicola]|nr:hypothetical protein CGRA01v4_08648 [Colletotrichum graminicola]
MYPSTFFRPPSSLHARYAHHQIPTCPGWGFATGRRRELGRAGTYPHFHFVPAFFPFLPLSVSVCGAWEVRGYPSTSAFSPAELYGLYPYSVRVC